MSEECYTMKDGTFIPMCMGAAARGKDYCTCKTTTKAELRQQLAAKEKELAELRRDRERCYKEAEKTISKILHGALSGTEPRYRTEDGYLRWGLVEQEIYQAIRHSQTENREGAG